MVQDVCELISQFASKRSQVNSQDYLFCQFLGYLIVSAVTHVQVVTSCYCEVMIKCMVYACELSHSSRLISFPYCS